MDFNSFNWRLTRLLLSFFGGWPFQKRVNRIIFGAIGFFMIDSIFIPEIIKLIIVRDNFKMVIDSVSLVILHSALQMKIISCHQNSQRIRKLLMQVRQDWQSDLTESEKKLLRIDGRKLKFIVTIYAIIYFSVAVVYMSMPLVPKILDYIAPLNKSRPNLPFYNTEFFIDPDKYSTEIYLFSCLCTPITPIVFAGFDTLYAGLSQHACSMFVIIGRRIQNLGSHSKFGAGRNNFEDENLKSLVESIKMHKKLIEYTQLLENNYSGIFFALLGVIILEISCTGFQVVGMENKLEDKLRILWFGVSQVFHLYVLSYFGQRLIDHSQYVYDSICATKWYNLSKKTRPLIILMMMRCKAASTITAGKLYTMSAGNFIVVMRTSISYFTVLLSAK